MNERIDNFHIIIGKIKDSNMLVIVEGRKDRIALEKLGLKNIIELSKKPLYQIVEEIASGNKEVIILTDLDKKGKELYGKLSRDMQKFGVRINNELREFLFKNTKLRQIEGFTNYLESF